jgi:hypothetical protein
LIPLLLASTVSLGCVALSARQLWRVSTWPSSDPEELLSQLKAQATSPREGLLALGDFETRLAHALSKNAAAQSAEIQDELLDLELRYKEGARIPAIATRIASTSGFLCSTLFLRRALLEVSESESPDFTGIILMGVNVVAVGLAGAWVCAALHRLSTRTMQARLRAFAIACDYLDDLASS